MKFLVINGPNLNKLGKRDKNHYGPGTYAELLDMIKSGASRRNLEVSFAQSNCEGEIIDIIQEGSSEYQGIVINPGAYSHYSYAIMDAIYDSPIPVVEVHISDVMNREDFRRVLITGKACRKIISGKGFNGYLEALDYLKELVESEKQD
jgi:3-dehydroquinate dehydratase II